MPCEESLESTRTNMMWLASVMFVGLIDQPVTEAQLRARIKPWTGYDMAEGRRPVLVYDDQLTWDRLLFGDAYARRTEPKQSWAPMPPLPLSVDHGVEQLRQEIDLEGRAVSQAHPGMVARWTDRGLVGLPAVWVWFAGIEHPYATLITEDLPPVVHLRDVYGVPIWHRRPGAYLHPDGRTLDAMFHGYQLGAVDYIAHHVLEADTAVTFSVAGRRAPGVNAIEDSSEERWIRIVLERPLGNRFLISDRTEPLIVAAATPKNWALDQERPTT